MSKAVLYALAIGLTYATLDKGVFRSGVGYTAEQLGDHLNDQNEAGEDYFVETDEDSVLGENPASGEVEVKPKSKSVVFKKAGADADKGETLTV